MVGPLKPTSLLAQLPEPKASKPPSSHETVERNYRRATVCLEYTRPRTSPTGDRAGCKHNIGLSCGEEGGVFFLTSPLIELIEELRSAYASGQVAEKRLVGKVKLNCLKSLIFGESPRAGAVGAGQVTGK